MKWKPLLGSMGVVEVVGVRVVIVETLDGVEKVEGSEVVDIFVRIQWFGERGC
jgi:hypothetical protein